MGILVYLLLGLAAVVVGLAYSVTGSEEEAAPGAGRLEGEG